MSICVILEDVDSIEEKRRYFSNSVSYFILPVQLLGGNALSSFVKKMQKNEIMTVDLDSNCGKSEARKARASGYDARTLIGAEGGG